MICRRVLLCGMGASALLAGSSACAYTSGKFIRIEEFGGSATPGFDNSDALRRALNEAASKAANVSLGRGTYEISAERLLSAGAIRRPSGVALTGVAEGGTVIEVRGASVFNQLFDASGASEVITQNIRFVGNGVKDENAPYACAIMLAMLRESATEAMHDIRFVNCGFDNFASAAWVLIENHSPQYTISRVGTVGCTWVSRAGAAPKAGAVTVPGHFIYIFGYRGLIEDVLVDDLTMHAAHMKGGVGLIGNISKGTIRVRSLNNAGQALSGVASDPEGNGAYGVLLYAKRSGAPRNIAVSIARLEDIYSVGIYSAGAHSNRYHIGYASGQRDTRDATLFKGVLVVQSGRDIDAHLDRVEDCNRVVMVSIDGGQDLGTDARDANIAIDLNIDSRRGARDITIDAGGSSQAGGVRITGMRSGPADVGVHLRSGPGVTLDRLDISRLVTKGARVPLLIGPGHVDLAGVLLPGQIK